MIGNLKGKVAIVTGSGQGIGEGIARCFAKAGAKILIVTRTARNGQAVADSITKEGGVASLLQTDVGQHDQVKRSVEHAVSNYGRLDIVVHNAAVYPVLPIEELSDADLDMTLAVNLKAGFWLIQAALPHLRKQGGGRFLFTSSVTGPNVAMPGTAHYAASKSGMNGLIRTAALEFARDNITVNGVEPGYIRTPAMEALGSEAEIAEMAKCIPLGKLGNPSDIANTMLFLASDEAAYITGQTIVVDGGSTLPESPVVLDAYYNSKKMTAQSLIDRRFNTLGRHSPLFYEKPLQLVRGEGVWVYDADGKRYLDAYNNVPHVGHCHPRVVEALCRQAGILNSHTRYLDETVVTYAERLLATFSPTLQRVFLTCTGSESNELALRIARECTGHMGVISTDFAYHGNSAAVSQISSVFTPASKRGPHVRCVPVIDPYRQRKGRSEEELADAYLGELQQAIDDLADNGVKLAAVLFCTAFSSEGLPDVPATYLPKVAAAVHAAGGLVIADEVQAGFGRFGSHMWGHDRHGMLPDIVTMGKPMGNGHPLAGVVTTAALMEQFTSHNMYFNTFGGNEVSAAVGLALLNVLQDEQLLQNAVSMGEYVLAGMQRLQHKYSLIGDVRGQGMFFGVEMVKDRNTCEPAAAQTKKIVNDMKERGVLISRIGPHDNILKIRPSMVFRSEHADHLLQTLDTVLAGVS